MALLNEAQGRGSLHCHMLIWLEGGLNPTEICHHILRQPGGKFEQRLISYLEANISTAIPDDPSDILNVPSSIYNTCSVRPICLSNDESLDSYMVQCHKDLFNLAMQCQRHSHNAGCYKHWKGPPKKKMCHFNLDESKTVPDT